MTNPEAGCYTIRIETMPMRFPASGRICRAPRLLLALLLASCSSGALAQLPSQSAGLALRQAQQSFEQGDFAAAARGFEQVRRASPETKEAWQSLILCYLRLGDRPRALDVEIGRAHV